MASPIACNEGKGYVLVWLHGLFFFSVAIPTNGLQNVFARPYMTYDALYDILASGVVGYIGFRQMCVLDHMFMSVTVSHDGVCWRDLVVARAT